MHSVNYSNNKAKKKYFQNTLKFTTKTIYFVPFGIANYKMK